MTNSYAIEESKGPGGIKVEELGSGERVILVHGGGQAGVDAWKSQLSLAARFRLVIPTRLGYPGSPVTARENFDDDAGQIAELVGVGAHLIGHSYGAVGAMLAACLRPAAVRSLTVIDAACSAVARGHEVIDAYERHMQQIVQNPPDNPGAFVRAVFGVLDPQAKLPDPLPPNLLAFGARLRTLRWPWEATIPLDLLAATPFPKLIVSGGRNPLYEVISDVLQQRLAAQRFVLIDAGHQLESAANALSDRLEKFLTAG